jgi:hypothetical protein
MDESTTEANVAEGQARRGGLLRRVADFAKQHPVTLLASAAAVGVVAGVEMAAGALIGIGATALLTVKKGRELREDALRLGREMLKRGTKRVEERREPPLPVTP